MTRIREDVHVHAPAAALYDRIASLPARARAGAALPLRRELAGMAAGETEPPALVVLLETDGGDDGASLTQRGAFRSLRWELHAEGPREVHIAAEAACRPADGLFGVLLEPWLREPRLRQALRDLLWFLKQAAEQDAGSGSARASVHEGP